MSLRGSVPVLVSDKDGEKSISIFHGQLTQKTFVEASARLKAAFPSLPPEFYLLLQERILDKGFSDERLKMAVKSIIDNCQYPTPTLGNFLSFDQRVKIWTYSELAAKISKGEISFNDCTHIRLNGKLFYVTKSDKEQFNIPDEL